MNASPFVEEVRSWLQLLPVEFQEAFTGSDRVCLFRIKDKNGRVLELCLQKLVDDNEYPSLPTSTDSPRRVTLWQDLWHTKKAIVQSRLLAQFGQSHRIPARLTQVHRVDRPTTLRFLQESHLQSPTLSKYSYGLYLPARHFRVLPFPGKHPVSPDPEKGLLVAVATFARPRNFPREGGVHRSFELVRFASLKHHTVVGGLGKLLKHFTVTHAPDDLMTYADLEWSDGNGYRKLGFEARGDTPPQTFWVDPPTMIRYESNRLPDGLDPQNAAEKGFVAVKNAGSRKFVKLIPPQIPKS